MPVVKDSLFVEAVWNIIFENVKNCLFSFDYIKSNLATLRNPILFRLNLFADLQQLINQLLWLFFNYIQYYLPITKLLLITAVTVILIRKTRH